jgi:hypothetical protein
MLGGSLAARVKMGIPAVVTPRARRSDPGSEASSRRLLGWPGSLLLTALSIGAASVAFSLHRLEPVALMAADPTCTSATVTWQGSAGDGAWSTAANWNPTRVPSAGDVACLPAGADVSTSGVAVTSVVIEAGAVLDHTGTNSIQLSGVLVNHGILRFSNSGGLRQGCGSRMVNSGRIQLAATAGSSTTTTFTAASGCSTPAKWWNTADGVIDSAATAPITSDTWAARENDGLVTARAGRLQWGGLFGAGADDGVSTGRFFGDGGTVELAHVNLGGPAVLDGTLAATRKLTGSAALPASGALALEGGQLEATLTGDGWVTAKDYAVVNGSVAGNLRIAPTTAYVVVGRPALGAPVTIQPTGRVEIATATAQKVFFEGNITNNGTVTVTGPAGFYQPCSAVLLNRSRIQLAATAGSSTTTTFTAASGCSTPAKWWNTADGVIDSAATAPISVDRDAGWENDGTLSASGGRWQIFATSVDGVHDGAFDSIGSGKLVLCGLFLTSDAAMVADDVALANQCGTVVTSVEGFTPAQIQDVRDLRQAAITAAGWTEDGLPACYFRGVNLTELYGSYPDVCNISYLTPEDRENLERIDFYISWMPYFGAALDIGHAIFGRTLSGRELSSQERILGALFAPVPGDADPLLLNGVERIAQRARRYPSCNSFAASTPVIMADASAKAISQIRVGDLVLATDPETGHTVPRPVTRVITDVDVKTIISIDLSSGERVQATENHPFWLQSQHRFVEAGKLEVGALLRTSAGTYVQVTALGQTVEHRRVFNLTVADLHTYHVGVSGVLVHNADACNKPVSQSLARSRLKAALGASPFPNGQAHHILPHSESEGPVGLKLSQDFDIDLNGTDNGVWLPARKISGLDPDFKGSFHNGMHGRYYTEYVTDYLSRSTSEQNAKDRLENLRTWLRNGCMPLNSLGVHVKPGKGTCPPELVTHYSNWGIEIES